VSRARQFGQRPLSQTLETVIATNANAKVTKHAKKALGKLDGESEQYAAGDIDLDLMHEETVAEPVAQPAPAQATAQPAAVIYAPAMGVGGIVVVPQAQPVVARNYEPISTAKKGMTMQEVYTLCGPP
jgi:hypothetical protein